MSGVWEGRSVLYCRIPAAAAESPCAVAAAPRADAGPTAIRFALLIIGLLILAAATLSPPPAGLSAEGLVALGLLAVMALWWFTEALPVTATALLPFVVLPASGAAKLADVAASYMSPVIFLVLGGAMLALAMEKSGLHRRLAVAVLSRAGAAPRGLVLAFMAATAFISMWVSNTASTLIMMPIAVSVLASVLPDEARRSPAERSFALTMVLGVAYAASIGGLGTLIGSPTNAIAAGVIEKTLGVHIGFLQWLAVGIPLVLVSIPLAWWVLTRVAFPFSLPEIASERLREAIGPRRRWSAAERRLLPVLLFAAGCWVLLPLLKIPQFAGIEDSTIAILAALALFVIPVGGAAEPEHQTAAADTLLNWRDTERVPWDVLMLFGGGLALAETITRTGLGTWLGGWIGGLGTLPMPVFIVLVTLVVIAVTEFASNVAAAASFIPVVAGIPVALGLDPLVLTLPAALAATWGFMMPAGTPPNAIAYATGYVRVSQMIRAGVWIDLLGLLVIPLSVTVGVALFL